MFTQTFVDGAQKTKKPYTVLFSLLLQISAICILILIPLLYTEVLPGAQLKSMLTAPPAPPPAPPAPVAKIQPRAAFRQFDAHRLIAPAKIPNQVDNVQEVAAAPDIGVPGGVAESGAVNGVVGSLLSAVPNNVPPPPPAPKPKPSSGAMRIGGIVAAANLIRQVQPVYPPLAKSARVQGTVEFTAIISKEGTIENLQLVRGHPLLVNAAKEAVLQWKYRPTLLNGQPVEVSTEVSVIFTLSP